MKINWSEMWDIQMVYLELVVIKGEKKLLFDDNK